MAGLLLFLIDGILQGGYDLVAQIQMKNSGMVSQPRMEIAEQDDKMPRNDWLVPHGGKLDSQECINHHLDTKILKNDGLAQCRKQIKNLTTRVESKNAQLTDMYKHITKFISHVEENFSKGITLRSLQEFQYILMKIFHGYEDAGGTI